MVPMFTMSRLTGCGVQLFPCSLATVTPQAFSVALVAGQSTSRLRSRRPHASEVDACAAAQPISTRLELVPPLRGFHHWFTFVTPFRLACRARAVW